MTKRIAIPLSEEVLIDCQYLVEGKAQDLTIDVKELTVHDIQKIISACSKVFSDMKGKTYKDIAQEVFDCTIPHISNLTLEQFRKLNFKVINVFFEQFKEVNPDFFLISASLGLTARVKKIVSVLYGGVDQILSQSLNAPEPSEQSPETTEKT